MLRTAISIALLVSLSACSMFGEKVVTKQVNQYLKITCPAPPSIANLKTRPIEPLAITDKIGIVWVAMSAKHYENLSHNTQESIRVIKDLKGEVRYYEKCIVDFNARIDGLIEKEKE